MPLHDTYLRCIANEHDPSRPRPVTEGVHIGGTIRPPKKTRDVHPMYPEVAQRAGQQGIVVIEAAITPAGCVGRAEVLVGVTRELDLSALRAVTGWTFTPTLLDGTAVPVIMTVTVQFSLQ